MRSAGFPTNALQFPYAGTTGHFLTGPSSRFFPPRPTSPTPPVICPTPFINTTLSCSIPWICVKKHTLKTIIGILFATLAIAGADELVLIDGTNVTGEIIGIVPAVKIQTSSGPRIIPIDQLDSDSQEKVLQPESPESSKAAEKNPPVHQNPPTAAATPIESPIQIGFCVERVGNTSLTVSVTSQISSSLGATPPEVGQKILIVGFPRQSEIAEGDTLYAKVVRTGVATSTDGIRKLRKSRVSG